MAFPPRKFVFSQYFCQNISSLFEERAFPICSKPELVPLTCGTTLLAFFVVMNLMNILMFAKFLIDLLSGTETKTELLF